MNELRKYLITSPLYTGVVTLRFDTDCVLYSVDFSADVTAPVRAFFLRNLHIDYAQLNQFIGFYNSKGKQLQLVEQTTEVSFDMMYNKYGLKKDRKRAEAIWQRLNDGDRVKAFLHVEKYRRDLKSRGIAQMELKTFLKAEIWND